MTAIPLVSVILPAYYSQQTIEQCLRALAGQSFRDFEVIVVDSTPDTRTVDLIRERFPEVQVHHSKVRLLPHAARNHGASFARGEILVFSDPDCRARPDWLARMVAAHREGHEVVCGAVANGSGWLSLAVHFTKFSWWLPGGRLGPRPQMATANCSLTRRMWDRSGPFRGERFSGDSELSWRLADRGHEIWFEPRAIVAHDQQPGFRALLRERYNRGRDFGATRVEAMEWPQTRCLLHVLAGPLIPFLMLWRAARYGLTRKTASEWMLTAPIQLLGYTAWCAGEARSHWGMLWSR